MKVAVFALSLVLLVPAVRAVSPAAHELMLPLPPFSRARAIRLLRRLEELLRPSVSSRATPPVEEGTTLESAVVVPVGSEDLLRGYENDWIFKYYGRFRRMGGGVGAREGLHFEVVRVELADGTERTFYFDITKAWGKSSSN